MIDINKQHSHDVMEEIKLTVTLDGDLAATIHNLIVSSIESGSLMHLLFCKHALPKLQALDKQISDRIDIENRVEE